MIKSIIITKLGQQKSKCDATSVAHQYLYD